MTTENTRKADHPVDPIFVNRWSPRAFTGEAISEEEFLTILEAARWAPSSFNSQPWRFVYAMRDTPEWSVLFDLLAEGNKGWAKNAAALIVMASKISMQIPGKDVPVESYSHSFDAGAAWGYLALQASMMGWHAHAMVGFDLPRAATQLEIPADYRVEVAIAIGRKGDPSILPESVRAREFPNPRVPIRSLVRTGKFSA